MSACTTESPQGGSKPPTITPHPPPSISMMIPPSVTPGGHLFYFGPHDLSDLGVGGGGGHGDYDKDLSPFVPHPSHLPLSRTASMSNFNLPTQGTLSRPSSYSNLTMLTQPVSYMPHGHQPFHFMAQSYIGSASSTPAHHSPTNPFPDFSSLLNSAAFNPLGHAAAAAAAALQASNSPNGLLMHSLQPLLVAAGSKEVQDDAASAKKRKAKAVRKAIPQPVQASSVKRQKVSAMLPNLPPVEIPAAAAAAVSNLRGAHGGEIVAVGRLPSLSKVPSPPPKVPTHLLPAAMPVKNPKTSKVSKKRSKDSSDEEDGGGKARSRAASSGYRGVSKCSKDGRWQARIRVKKVVTYLGRYINEIDAAKRYDEVARLYHGEKAMLNFPSHGDLAAGRKTANGSVDEN